MGKIKVFLSENFCIFECYQQYLPHIMNIEEIIFDSPLYSRWKRNVEIEEDHVIIQYNLDYLISSFKNRVDRYCTKCDKHRIFAADQNIFDVPNIRSEHYPYKIEDKPIFFKSFRCSAYPDHKILFSFIVEGDEVIKISEFPSKYDSVKDTFNDYKKILEKEKITELSKAAQLESFGYAIASLLYYRRIFESIILKTFSESDFENKITEEEFRQKRMNEKTDYIAAFLPEYFKENSHMYGILSKGVHELEEDECRKYLPIVKAIIFFSLDEAVEKRNKEIRKAEMAKKLAEANSKLK